MSQNILFFFYLHHLKNVKSILISGTVQKQVADWIWPTGDGLPTPILEDAITMSSKPQLLMFFEGKGLLILIHLPL